MAAEPQAYWIMLVDIEDFSSRSDPFQKELRRSLAKVVNTAFSDAHLPLDVITMMDEGDGFLILIPAYVSPIALVGDAIRALNRGLAENDAMTSASLRMRLRVAVHQGMVSRDERGWSGAAVITACRLVDVDLLRRALINATRARLALLVSDDFYRNAVSPGHRSVDPGEFVPVRVDLKKHPNFPAWLHVPDYSAPPGITPDPGDRPVSQDPDWKSEPEVSSLRNISVRNTTGTVQRDQIFNLGDNYRFGDDYYDPGEPA
jgi:hypothetical protein